MSVVGETRTSGYGYRVVVHLRETAGIAATISSVDLTFTNGTTMVVSSHTDQPIADGANVCPANGAVDTREILTLDANSAHPYATAVQAKVTFTDGASFVGTPSSSADVPPLPGPPPPQTYTLRGVITDMGTHVGIAGARLDVLNGLNAGKTAVTDGSGTYLLDGLVAEVFRLRASADGYDFGEQNVTVPADPRADFVLLRSAGAPCAYVVAPTGSRNVSADGGQLSVSVTQTSGTCGWQATTDASWITLGSKSGSGTASLTITFGPNVSRALQTGTVTVQWSGGSAQLTLSQPPELIEPICIVTVTVAGQNPIAVPASGGSYTASIAPLLGVDPASCGAWTASSTGPISFVGPTSGPRIPGVVTFIVPANASTTAISMLVSVSVAGDGVSTLTVNQAAGP